MTMEQIITYLVYGAVGLVALTLGCLFIRYFGPIGEYIKTGLESKRYTVIWNLAQEAYSYVEKMAQEAEEIGAEKVLGSAKAAAAFEYFEQHMGKWGVNLSSNQIKAVIQQAWTVLERIPRQQSSNTVIHTESTVTKDAIMADIQAELKKVAYPNDRG